MTSVNQINAATRETAIILLEEGRQQYKRNQIEAARASFKEAASLDPANRDVWLCLASVSSGEERAFYLKKVGRKASSPPTAVITPEDAPMRTRQPAHGWHIPAIAGGAVLFIALAAVYFVMLYHKIVSEAPVTAGVENTRPLVSSATGGVISYKGMSGLYIPAHSLKQDEQFQLTAPNHLPPFPTDEIFQPVGAAVQVKTTASVLMRPAWVGFRYDPAQLPAGAIEESIRVARWDGNNWELVDSAPDFEQKLVYSPVAHFSEPVFTLVVWSPSNPSSLLGQVTAVSKDFYADPINPSNPGRFEEIMKNMPAAGELKNIPEGDLQAYWAACNLWGESLFRLGQLDQAGAVFRACVEQGAASGLAIDWASGLMSGPGYALNALQNRYPLGVELNQALRQSGWAKDIPPDLLQLASDKFIWRLDSPIELVDLPPAVQKSVAEFEASLNPNPPETTTTSLDLLVLSAQSQTGVLLEGTLDEVVSYYLNSSAIADVGGALKEDAQGLLPAIAAYLQADTHGNRYTNSPGQPGEDIHSNAPVILLRVERVWEAPEGLNHTQHIFTLGPGTEAAGAAVGDPLAVEKVFHYDGKTLSAGTLEDRWVRLGATMTQNIQANFTFDELGLSSGRDFTCALTNVHGVRCWGKNESGQLGVGDFQNRTAPVDVPELNFGVRQVATGEAHTCALKNDGQVFCWGNNSSGQLGNNGSEARPQPTAVQKLPSPAVMVATGAYHTCALGQDGKVYCWGNNLSGQLGDGTGASTGLPVTVAGLDGARSITAGAAHTCALTERGAMYCWGANERGQLGTGTQEASLTPTPVAGLSEIQAIAAGGEHTCALTSPGGVYCWGLNTAGQVGDGSGETSVREPRPVKGMQAGVTMLRTFQNHTCVIREGQLYCWGLNNAGQVGSGSPENQPVPVTLAGINGTFVSVSPGNEHTCARLNNSYIYCWGRNSLGQLGNRQTTDSLTPVAVVGFGTNIADTTGKIEISPAGEGSIELGSTVEVKLSSLTQDFPGGVKKTTFYAAYDGGAYVEIGGNRGPAEESAQWSSTGSERGKTVIFRVVVVDNTGASTEYITRAMTITDTRIPTARLEISPSEKVIELGSSVKMTASEVSDAVDGIRGSGVKEITLKVLENGAETFTDTQLYQEGRNVEVIWPAPMVRKSHNTLVTFVLVVTDQAGNQYEVSEGGFSLYDRLSPSFIGDFQVGGDGVNGTKIEMGSDVGLTVSLSDMQNGRQGSGIRSVQFQVAVGSGSFDTFEEQSLPGAPIDVTVQSKVWSSSQASYKDNVQFRAIITDIAGNRTTKTSAIYSMDDNQPPDKPSLTTDYQESDPKLSKITLSISNINDGEGTGVKQIDIKVTCTGTGVTVSPITSGISETVNVPIEIGTNCNWNSDIKFDVTLSDGKEDTPNTSSASISVNYKYDIESPTGSLNVEWNPGSKSYTVSLTGLEDTRSKPVTAKGGFTISCGSGEFTNGVFSGTSGTWAETDLFSNDACGYGTEVTFKATIQDSAGNTTNLSTTIPYDFDSDPPVLSSLEIPAVISSKNQVKVHVTDEGGKGLSTVTLFAVQNDSMIKLQTLDATSIPGPIDSKDVTFTWSKDFTSLLNLSCGTPFTLNFSATDAFGREASSTNTATSTYQLHLSGSLTAGNINSYSAWNVSADLDPTCAPIYSPAFVLSGTSSGHTLTLDAVNSNRHLTASWNPVTGPGYSFETGETVTVRVVAYADTSKTKVISADADLTKNVQYTINTNVGPLSLTVNKNSTNNPVNFNAYETSLSGATVTRTIYTQPSQGTAFVDETTGLVSYTPQNGSTSSDSFVVRLEKETHQYWLVTVDVTVNNQAPTVTGNISKTGDTVTFTALDFTTVFSDPNPGDTLSAVIITSLPTNNGALSLGGAPIETTGISIPLASLNSLVLTLDASDLQASSFSFRLVDSSGAQSSNVGSVTLSPLPAPHP